MVEVVRIIHVKGFAAVFINRIYSGASTFNKDIKEDIRGSNGEVFLSQKTIEAILSVRGSNVAKGTMRVYICISNTTVIFIGVVRTYTVDVEVRGRLNRNSSRDRQPISGCMTN